LARQEKISEAGGPALAEDEAMSRTPYHHGSAYWVNWPKVQAQIDAKGPPRPKPGPHGMLGGETYEICGNVSEPRPSRTRRGLPVVDFLLLRKNHPPLPCVAFSKAAEHLAALAGTHGLTQPYGLTGTFREEEGKEPRFIVERSSLPRLHQALFSAARLGERFECLG
jgi:hypothetical protein